MSTEGADAGESIAYDVFNMTPKWKNWLTAAEKRLDESHGEQADPPMGKQDRRDDPTEKHWRADGYEDSSLDSLS